MAFTPATLRRLGGVGSGNTRDLTATPPVSGVVDLTNFTAIGTIDSD